MILGQRTVVYGVDDMQKAKTWYSQLLQKKPYFENDFYIGYDVGGFELGLQLKKALFGEQFGKQKKQDIGNIAYWGVEHIQKELQRLAELKVEIVHPIVDVGEGILMADFLDPFGNLFGLIENPNFQLK